MLPGLTVTHFREGYPYRGGTYAMNAEQEEEGQRAPAGLKIAHISVHGLIRPHDLELGRNADTGGQTKYVVQLTRALESCPDIESVKLFTRLIDDPDHSEDYALPRQELGDNAELVRLECGPQGYIRKEELYPHLAEFTRNFLAWCRDNDWHPDVIHGHYADAGRVGMDAAAELGVPFLFTGHSLGRNKRKVLLAAGEDETEIEERYNFTERIAIEEEALERAQLVVASTNFEIETGYQQYDAAAKAEFRVRPPGIDLEEFHPYYYALEPGFVRSEEQMQAAQRMRHEISRFLGQPDKPMILAVSRPDRRKNIAGLVEAYGQDRELRELANLVIFAGVRRDIEKMDDNEREVLTELLLLMDRLDLYGRLALPKKHDPATDIPELYRMAATQRGVFINPALVENFGLTLIEAAACGVPLVSTGFGGPSDIIGNCHNGILVDSSDESQIQEALKRILTRPELWQEYSDNGINGVREHYVWDNHCELYLEASGK